jgi:NAD(P)-dependent dehydrogenase (short-subunit alcohol dehydrogenase family)
MASVRLTRLVWPGMVARRWGRVINVLNTFSKAPIGGSAPTSVTRAAQLALTKVLSHEGGPYNVLVNALLVGLIRSDQVVRLQRELAPEQPLERFIAQKVTAARIPVGRMGEASEFANIACFLASDAASYITGTAINVDGGMAPVV